MPQGTYRQGVRHMRIPVDKTSPLPLYTQIARFIRHRIECGALPAGTRLPAIRVLARELGVNRITVETAYAELDASGLVAARVGSGTYVLPPYSTPARTLSRENAPRGETPARSPDAVCDPWPLWQHHALRRHSFLSAPPAIPLASHAPQADIIALNSGNSDPRLFPVDQLRASLRETLRREGWKAAEYEEVAGYPPLRRTISHLLADQGIPAAPQDIIITAGSQQALALACQLLTAPGDCVLVESPSYADGLDLFRSRGLRVIPVPMDEEGMRTDLLPALLKEHAPRLIYTIPNFHNPTGICMSGQRRRQLVHMAREHGIPLLEDDFVGELRYEGHAQPALKALAHPGDTLYAGTFSKMLMPGLRVGYLVAEGPVRDLLIRCKRLNDLSSSGIIQRALHRFVSVGRHRAHLARSCHIYRKRRNALLQAMAEHLPQVRIAPIQGGLFAWCTLPAPLTAGSLAPLALHHGVAVAPGTAFFLHPEQGAAHLRLNFALHDPETLQEAVRRLALAVRQAQKSVDRTKNSCAS